MIPVSSLDAGMLYAETPEMPMHTMGILLLETPAHPVFERLGRVIEERLQLLAPFGRRLLEDPLRIGAPHWIEDPDFALGNHLHRAAIPAPGEMRELSNFVADAPRRGDGVCTRQARSIPRSAGGGSCAVGSRMSD